MLKLDPGFKKTAEGIIFSYSTVKSLVGLLALVAAVGVFVLRQQDKIEGAMQRGEFRTVRAEIITEFRDTTRAIREDIRAVGAAAEAANRAAETANRTAESAAKKSNAISCYTAKYPAGLCDDVPRVGGNP